jgi:hypothetical protein
MAQGENFVSWPKTRDELRDEGYGFKSHTTCRSMSCQKKIEMWLTPAGKIMPLSSIEDKLQPHFADCVDAAKFRRAQR